MAPVNLDWSAFERSGYLRLGRLLSDGELDVVRARIDAIMLGQADVDYERLLMQLDSADGRYGALGEQTLGHKGATLGYRKIQGLERDPVHRRYVEHVLFREICAHTYGATTPIACFRAMFMNKPARAGTSLPWHQDRWIALDRDPLITVYTALDAATRENGCIEMIPHSHGRVINPKHHSAFLERDQVKAHCDPADVIPLEMEPGEAVLLHNWTLHRSGINATEQPRRAFSVCYMDARTVDRTGVRYTELFGPCDASPSA